jgi:hypothetical protein
VDIATSIKEMTILSNCTLEVIKFLINLCPRLQHLTLEYLKDNFNFLLQFLLSKDKDNMRHLFSLCIKNLFERQVDELKFIIASKKLLDVYLMKIKYNLYNHEVYLWW